MLMMALPSAFVGCSQLAGVAAASPRASYVLFLDDDVLMAPDTIQELVSTLESDPTLFMATGGS